MLSLLSPQAVGDYMGVALRNQRVHWVYRLGEAGPAALSVDEDIGEQFAAVSIDRWVTWPPWAPSIAGRGPLLTPHSAFRTLQFGHMSVTVEKQMLHETKGDTVAPGAEGLLNLRPDDFVFYVGGYPSHFTVSLAGRGGGGPALRSQDVLLCAWLPTECPPWGLSWGREALTVLCACSPPNPSASLATWAASKWRRSTRRC